MTLPKLFLSSVVCAAFATSCGELTSTTGHTAPALFVVHGEVSGQLVDNGGELRAALGWSVFGSDLIECVDAVDVDGPLDWMLDEQDAQTANALERCLTYSARGRTETSSVALQPSLPASFSIPVATLPEPALLSGDDNARLGIASVLIYTDDNGNEHFDETPRGASAFIDTIHGTSEPTSDEAEQASWLIYREGDVSPLWKLFVALYGCAEPPAGFSSVTVAFNHTSGVVTCTIDQRPIDVVLGDFATFGCAADPGAERMIRPTEIGPDADSVSICDGSSDLFVTTNPDSVCPSYAFYTLYGCDLSSEAACSRTFWDLQDTPPSWWPCVEGSRTLLNIDDERFATDEQDDRLFSVVFHSGTPIVPQDDLTIALVGGETRILFSGTSLTLVDNDNNGAFNAGDVVHVGERNNELTRATIATGSYAVMVVGLEAEVFGGYEPFALETVAQIEVTAVDAPANITDGVDDVAIVTWSGPIDAEPRPFAGLSADAYVGGELPIVLTVHLHEDENGDGRFGPGDAVMLRDSAGGGVAAPALSVETLRAFGNPLYVSLYTDVGVNSPVALASAAVVVE